MREHEELTVDQALELLRQHHADGDDFGTDAAITIKRAQNEFDRLRSRLARVKQQCIPRTDDVPADVDLWVKLYEYQSESYYCVWMRRVGLICQTIGRAPDYRPDTEGACVLPVINVE